MAFLWSGDLRFEMVGYGFDICVWKCFFMVCFFYLFVMAIFFFGSTKALGSNCFAMAFLWSGDLRFEMAFLWFVFSTSL